MRIIPTRIHGLIDYLVGIIMIVSPWVFNFDNGGAETWIPVAVGVMVLLQTIMTNFEVGFMKVIPMATHLRMDLLVGLLLIASPWLFNFDEQVWVPHVVFGIFAVMASLMTRTAPENLASRNALTNNLNNR